VVRGKTVAQARALLQFTVKRAADPVLKLLNSAVASATHDLHLEESNLKISSITVDQGPTLKRSFPMSRGRAYPIMKRTSHITLVVGEINPGEGKKAPKPVKDKKEARISKEPKAVKDPSVKKAAKRKKESKK
jgi:large subunit ribosomal protein L22